MDKADVIQDAIPQEDFLETSGPNEAGMVAQHFFAFNTAITLQAFADERDCLAAFGRVRKEARRLERLFSRTLSHSDISRLNRAGGPPVEISRDTADLLECALSYCADSDGRFDITMGAAVQLWDLRRAIIPSQDALREAVAHVDWRGVRVREESGRYFAQLADPQAAVDVGGIAKGWIADKFTSVLLEEGLEDFLINLGGNVVAHGEKPGGIAWNIGIRDPRDENSIVGAVPLCDAAAFTSAAARSTGSSTTISSRPKRECPCRPTSQEQPSSPIGRSTPRDIPPPCSHLAPCGGSPSHENIPPSARRFSSRATGTCLNRSGVRRR